jgi:hypothetical protein
MMGLSCWRRCWEGLCWIFCMSRYMGVCVRVCVCVCVWAVYLWCGECSVWWIGWYAYLIQLSHTHFSHTLSHMLTYKHSYSRSHTHTHTHSHTITYKNLHSHTHTHTHTLSRIHAGKSRWGNLSRSCCFPPTARSRFHKREHESIFRWTRQWKQGGCSEV